MPAPWNVAAAYRRNPVIESERPEGHAVKVVSSDNSLVFIAHVRDADRKRPKAWHDDDGVSKSEGLLLDPFGIAGIPGGLINPIRRVSDNRVDAPERGQDFQAVAKVEGRVAYMLNSSAHLYTFAELER